MACRVEFSTAIKSGMFSSMSDDEVFRQAFGLSAPVVLQECDTQLDMTFSEFTEHCTILDGRLGDYFLSGLQDVAPSIYAVIPECNGDVIVRFVAICRILNRILRKEESEDGRQTDGHSS